MLLSMVRNFKANVFGREIAVDVAHKPENGAAAYIKKFFVDVGKLRVLVEWTSFVFVSVEDRGYRYFSTEYHGELVDSEGGASHGAPLFGMGWVVCPCIKSLDTIELSDVSLNGRNVVNVTVGKRMVKIPGIYLLRMTRDRSYPGV